MQTILGANGVIAKELAKALPAYTENIRLVSRDPKKVNQTDQLFKADITSAEQTMKAVEGSDVVYLTIGLKYDIKVWKHDWPIIMRNVIDACKRNRSKLIFFDNVYALGKVNGWMTENTPMNPISEKGKVRKILDEMVLESISNGAVQAIIARSADFYGPDAPLSIVNMLLLNKYGQGKGGQLLISDKFKHSYTYTPDAAKALAILGNAPSAFNRIWHLPTDRNVLTGKEFAELAAKLYNAKPKYRNLPKWALGFLGLFNHDIKEILEMTYQYDSDYLFDSSDFEKTFGFQTTLYSKGLEETAESMKIMN
jgi:nucleoside-diphosphate-sugar epimerase